MTLLVPTRPVANQTFQVVLSSQPCTINIYQKSTGLFMDVIVNDVPIISGVICLNEVFIVRDAYLGFLGDLAWLDFQGSDDPVSTGLGSRFMLLYDEPAVATS